MHGLDPSEMDIKVFIPALIKPNFIKQCIEKISIDGKYRKASSFNFYGGNKINIKNSEMGHVRLQG